MQTQTETQLDPVIAGYRLLAAHPSAFKWIPRDGPGRGRGAPRRVRGGDDIRPLWRLIGSIEDPTLRSAVLAALPSPQPPARLRIAAEAAAAVESWIALGIARRSEWQGARKRVAR